MRFVPLHSSGGPTHSDGTANTAWLVRAKALAAQLVTAQDKAARDALIDANAQLWGELRDWLLRLSHDKCWYSEARDLFSVPEVEHFRPKKRCKRAPRGATTDGYWWLAFDWSNYRLCGKVGNARKGDFFPLATGSMVASHNGTSILNEVPLLLDPACPGDANLLSFNEDGACGPHADADAFTQLRVTTTTARLNLNHGRVRKGRQRIWARCRHLIDECRRLAPNAASPAEKATIAQMQDELRRMTREQSEFSATARDCLLKSNIGWAASLAAG